MNVYPLTRGYYSSMVFDLGVTDPIHTGEWQALKTAGSKAHATHELEDVTVFIGQLPETSLELASMIPAVDLDWAEEHFVERVSGIPYNPAPSATRWPYAVRWNSDHTTDAGQYDHTYPERFWPKMANVGETRPNGRQVFVPHNGIRFEYGDYQDVVDLLVRSPLTRQAYLPVWFPEDTGAVDGQRVPCTLGYHFMIRDGKLSIRYYIRSCDIYRHMSNDLYFAGRLAQWTVSQINAQLNKLYKDNPEDNTLAPNYEISVGKLVMNITSLHMFVGDNRKMQERSEKW